LSALKVAGDASNPMHFKDAATTAGVTAWRALIVNGALKAGDTVLVLGTGGVSWGWVSLLANAAFWHYLAVFKL
jgi:NADPH:quinone reductase-like Zn-dependent oxidoreductase